jgi:hypothetical protein
MVTSRIITFATTTVVELNADAVTLALLSIRTLNGSPVPLTVWIEDQIVGRRAFTVAPGVDDTRVSPIALTLGVGGVGLPPNTMLGVTVGG